MFLIILRFLLFNKWKWVSKCSYTVFVFLFFTEFMLTIISCFFLLFCNRNWCFDKKNKRTFLCKFWFYIKKTNEHEFPKWCFEVIFDFAKILHVCSEIIYSEHQRTVSILISQSKKLNYYKKFKSVVIHKRIKQTFIEQECSACQKSQLCLVPKVGVSLPFPLVFSYFFMFILH